jgi:hypothetical protein
MTSTMTLMTTMTTTTMTTRTTMMTTTKTTAMTLDNNAIICLSYYPFGGKLLKPGNRFCRLPNDRRPTTNNQPATEELNNSGNRAWHRPCITNNLFEVWKNLVIFGGRPIGAAVEALLAKDVNW